MVCVVCMVFIVCMVCVCVRAMYGMYEMYQCMVCRIKGCLDEKLREHMARGHLHSPYFTLNEASVSISLNLFNSWLIQ